jgi:hypothetical protein
MVPSNAEVLTVDRYSKRSITLYARFWQKKTEGRFSRNGGRKESHKQKKTINISNNHFRGVRLPREFDYHTIVCTA